MDYRVKELDKKTWLIEEYNEQMHVYMYLLEGEEEAALIDAGMGLIPLAEICGKLTSKPIKVLLTHGHVDHIGGTGFFEEVYLAPEDKETYHLHSDSEFQKFFSKEPLPETKKDLKALVDGMVFELGDRPVEVITVPGHSLGSVCFLDYKHRWLFVGDTSCKAHVLLQMDYSAPMTTFLASIKKLQGRRAEYDVIWPGHHAQPVEIEVLEQYRVATEGLLNESLKGEPFEQGGPDVKLLKYCDIGIEYK